MKHEFVTTEKVRKMKKNCCTYNWLQKTAINLKSRPPLLDDVLHGTVDSSWTRLIG